MSIFDGFLSSVGSLFGGSDAASTATSTTDSSGGFLSSLFSPKNIASAIGGIGSVLGEQDKANQAQSIADASNQNKIDLSNLDFQHQVDLLKLKASLGGGGGGGGGGGAAMAALNYQKQRDKQNRIQQAFQDAVTGSQNSSSLTIQALKNLTAGAQAPLGMKL